jgi:hypothetical protein
MRSTIIIFIAVLSFCLLNLPLCCCFELSHRQLLHRIFPTKSFDTNSNNFISSNLQSNVQANRRSCELSPSFTRLFSSVDVEVESPAKILRKKLRGTNIFFVGMMGSGKSTVGKEFARMLDYRFLDTDELAEFMIEMPIAEFFEQGKVDEFRQVEYQILMEMSQYTRLTLATGTIISSSELG